MPVGVTGAVLAAAVLHATWNALLKGGRDRVATVVLLDLTGLVLSALAVALVPAPAPASRGLLVASVVLHVGYELLLLRSYRVGDLSQAYPLARGTAPLLVAGYAGLVLGEFLLELGLIGQRVNPSAGGSWKVQLGAFPSPEAARTQWTVLSKKIPALAGLEASYHLGTAAGASIAGALVGAYALALGWRALRPAP